MMTNRYSGRCSGCGARVEAGTGAYDGSVWCEEPSNGGTLTIDGEEIWIATYTCSTGLRSEARAVLRGRAARAAYLASAEYGAEVAAWAERDRERARLEEQRQRRGMTACGRCGGAGGHATWPGWSCFDCGGSGELPIESN